MPQAKQMVYQQFLAHAAKWRDCRRCPLAEGRCNVVLARGKVPCDVLFVGEAPGAGEDVVGQPFVGPAGKLLDALIADAAPGALRLAFTNLVACIPLGEDGAKTAKPPREAIKACWPRLREFARIARPRLIVLVGDDAKKNISGAAQFRLDDKLEQPEWVAPDRVLEFLEIVHPAFILRAKEVEHGLLMQRVTVALANAFEGLR